ncbi:lysozyme-like protein [Auricularia subglabra TFB-10046 SS5]|nr:lysozyme-like protein [Auricularia subglabra TFB-10046 SS5]
MKAAFLALLVALFATLAQASLHNDAISHRRHSSALLERAAAKKNGLRRSGARCNKNATTKVAPTATKALAKPKPKQTASNVAGLIRTNWKCNGKSSGASPNVTVSSGPNGSQDWLNCGINGGGWTPPPVKLKDLVVVSLRDSLKDKNSPFHACGPYLNIFEKYAKRYGLEPILLASFAMQESGCKPETQGMGGEQGMMQITREKCKGRSDAACREPDYNIGTAAKFFSDTLKGDGGNIILSVGRYNGFHEGLTYKKATAARYTKCCRCMNNLDYPMQYFNGWLLGKNPYGMKLGTVNNLAWCPKNN